MELCYILFGCGDWLSIRGFEGVLIVWFIKMNLISLKTTTITISGGTDTNTLQATLVSTTKRKKKQLQ